MCLPSAAKDNTLQTMRQIIRGDKKYPLRVNFDVLENYLWNVALHCLKSGLYSIEIVFPSIYIWLYQS